jgi:chromosome segregation ATPase
LCFC